ncbi:MAG: hypothetical protein LC792_11055 [Actinobacteria bacterium]|nr:hypothetical protein [Actinomycetota bacterium]
MKIRQQITALNEPIWGDRLKVAAGCVVATLALFLAFTLVVGLARTQMDNKVCGGKSNTSCIAARRSFRWGPFKAFVDGNPLGTSANHGHGYD